MNNTIYLRFHGSKITEENYLLKITKLSAIVLIFYVLFYCQVWGNNHLILYGTAIISVVNMLVYCFQQGHIDLTKVPFGVWNNLIMVLYALITGFFVSYNYGATIKSCVTYAAFSMVCVAICYVSAEEGSFEWVLKVLIALAFTCAVYALFRGAYWQGYGRTLSLMNNPHALAAVMYLGIFSVAFIRRNKNKVASAVSIILIALFYYSIIECGSRKYLISSGALIIILLAAIFKDQLEKSDTQNKIIWIILGVLFTLLAIWLFRSVYSQSYTYLRMQDMDDAGNQYRILYYRKAWDIFLEHPFFGGGYDQFRYRTNYGIVGGYAHSTYAEAIADFGFVGCIIYFLPIFYVSYQIIKRAVITERNYTSLLLGAFCIAELFLGVGQIFFMEFYHFLAWMILFYYSKKANTEGSSEVIQRVIPVHFKCKYIRDI